jgi:hypothetical protein
MIALEAIISGANPIPLQGPLAAVAFRHAARRHVRASRLIVVRTAVRWRRLGRRWDVWRRRAAAVRFEKPNKKPATGFPGAGSNLAMMDIWR